MSKVVYLQNETTLPIPPDRILNEAIDELEDVVLVGTAKDGSLYFASSETSRARMLYLLELAKLEVMEDAGP